MCKVRIHKIRVVIYARYSSDMQREESIDAQIRYCKNYIESHDEYELVEIYFDEAKSAKEGIEHRENFQRMIADAKAGKFDIVLVHKFNRFARNKLDSAIYKKKLLDIGIRVVSASQAIDDTPEGRMMESMLEAIDQYYSENLGLEVTKGLIENAINGKSTGGSAPLGFYYDTEGKLREDKEKSFIIKTIFNMFLDGYGSHTIAMYLNEHGYRTARGKEFSSTAIMKIIKNEKYAGTFLYTIGKEHFRWENNHDALISRQDFNKVQEIIAKRGSKPRVKSKYLYSLTGRMTCGKCGGNYAGGGKSRNDVYYVCINKVRKKTCDNLSVSKTKLEGMICDYIISELLGDNSVSKIADTFDAIIQESLGDGTTATIEGLKKEKAILQQEQEKLLDLYLDPNSPMDKKLLSERTQQAKDRLRAVEAEIRSLILKNTATITRADTIEYLNNFKSSFDKSDKHMVKALIDTFVDGVIVRDNVIDVTYKVDINPIIQETDEHDGDPPPWGDNDNSFLAELSFAPLIFRGNVNREILRATP